MLSQELIWGVDIFFLAPQADSFYEQAFKKL